MIKSRNTNTYSHTHRGWPREIINTTEMQPLKQNTRFPEPQNSQCKGTTTRIWILQSGLGLKKICNCENIGVGVIDSSVSRTESNLLVNETEDIVIPDTQIFMYYLPQVCSEI